MATIKPSLPDNHRLAEFRGETGSLQTNISDNPDNDFDFEFVPDNHAGIFFFVNADEIDAEPHEIP